jgi:hypothetical protein
LLTLLLLGCGWLPAASLTRWLASRLIGYRREASLCFCERGLSIDERTQLSGRTLVAARRFIPRENLARVSREVRYSGSALRVGLVALILGTYVGTGLIRDGGLARSPSPQLIASGLLILALGVLIDFVLSTAIDSRRGRCRVVIEPRRGSAFSCCHVDASLADQALHRLAGDPD